jgi:copper chaperone CopZ
MTAELMVEGVGCASCELPLRRSLGKLVGVVRIREGSTKQHLLVDFIPQQLAADRIVDAVYEAGYSAEVLVRATES